MSRDRSSEAQEPSLISDAQEIARIEAENTLRQFDAAMLELRAWIGDPTYRLRPSTVLRLNRIALERVSKYAGVFRPGDVKISGSTHEPVPSERVPELIEEFCEYINDNWRERSALHLCAYALWRINWIHPFVDGNGRTARIVSYLILCAKLGYRLPGTKTIPEQIAGNKQPYYQALEAADAAAVKGEVDVTQLEKMLDAHLAAQLVDIHNSASNTASAFRGAVAEYPDSGTAPDAHEKRRPQLANFARHVEAHPVIYGFVGLLIATLLGAMFVG